MKIINNFNQAATFSSIKVGECFMYDNCLFIKMHPAKKDANFSWNAFCFVDNAIAQFKDEWHVIPVDARVVINGKGTKE